MTKHEQGISLTAEYLNRHRFDPLERDGWFSGYEIYRGVREEFAARLLNHHVYQALDFLMQVEPPVIEDTWMTRRDDHTPMVEAHFQHDDAPKQARRFYRALGGITDFVTVELPAGNFNTSVS